MSIGKSLWGGLLFCILTSLSAGITLTEKGKTQYVIVTAENATTAEQNAAQELHDCLKKVTGKDFRIVDQKQAGTLRGIFVGNTDFASANGMKQGSFGREEWCIRNVGKDIVIAGGRPRGVLNGVYEFLERFAGCRRYGLEMRRMPTIGNLAIPDGLDIAGRPPFLYRDIYYLSTGIPRDAYYDSRAWNKLFSYAAPAKYGFSEMSGSPSAGHTYLVYAADFPEDISWMAPNGHRSRVTVTTGGQICYSHPEVRRRFAEKLRGYIKADRTACDKDGKPYPIIYAVNANDCGTLCYCPECRALAEKYNPSGMVIDFTNAVAAAIAKEYPDVLVMMFAYKEAAAPPRGIKARDNVMVQMALMDVEFSGAENRDVLRPVTHPHNSQFVKTLDAWRKSAANLALWDYWRLYYDLFPTPYSIVGNLPAKIRLYREFGIKQVFVEFPLMVKPGIQCPNSFIDLTVYAGAKLLDNPDLDYPALIADFMTGVYGKGAPFMYEYLNYLETRMREEPDYMSRKGAPSRRYLDGEFFRRANELLDAAENAAAAAGEHDAVININQERLPVDLAYINLMKSSLFGNPLGVDRETLWTRIERNMKNFAKKYYTAEYAAETLPKTLVYYRSKLESPPLPPEFAGRKVLDFTWSDFRGNQVADPDAPGGRACTVYKQYFSGKEPLHGKPFELGIYAGNAEPKQVLRYTIEPSKVPADEKYHFYYVGRCRIPQNAMIWLHWTWLLSMPLRDVYDPTDVNAQYDIFVQLKLQGPAYVKGSSASDDVRLGRIIFEKVSGNEAVKVPAELSNRAVVKVIPAEKFTYHVARVPDDGALNRTAVKPVDDKIVDMHAQLPAFGLTDTATGVRPITRQISRKELQTDGKFHLYKLGTAKLTPTMQLWGHFSWSMCVPLKDYYDPVQPDVAYDLFISLKVTGPAYIDGDKAENRFLVDALYLVR